MSGSRFKTLMLAAAATLGANAALAADYAPPPPPPVYAPPPQPCCNNWYLRGYVGAGITSGDDAEFIQNSANSSNFAFDSTSYADQMFIGGGFGYAVNNWLRIEATAEYRAKSRVYAFGHYTSGGDFAIDEYQGNLSSWVLLANAFIDLGTWDCFTPFIGAGVGGGLQHALRFHRHQPIAGRLRHRPQPERMASGLGALCRPVLSGDAELQHRSDLPLSQLRLDHRHGRLLRRLQSRLVQVRQSPSNDIMLSLRWTCCDYAPPAPPRYVYRPPPPPPLESRG